MAYRHRPERTEGERHPLRRLSSIGRTTSGWRSTLETTPHASLGTFILGALIAGGVVALLMVIATLLANR